jgi:hypothetical protein
MKKWAETGTQNAQTDIDGNEKDSFALMATVTAARTKLPLVVIASGKTERCEVGQCGEDIADHWTDHSESVWTTVETFRHFLDFSRSYSNDQERLWLVSDCYSVHRTENITKHADKLGIYFVFIPARMTDAHRPLDRSIFGVMNAAGRRISTTTMR